MALVVVVNSVQVVVDAEVYAQCKYHDVQEACHMAHGWLDKMNWGYLLFYTAELLLKAYAYHLETLCNSWNIFDLLIVITGYTTQALGDLPSVGILRLLRLMRLAKALRLVRLPTELHIMFQGFFSALTAISFGVIVVGVMITFWAVIGVVLIAPLSRQSSVVAHYDRWECEGCKDAWTTLWNAIVTLFGLLLFGEGYNSIVTPLLIEAPLTIVYFTLAVFTVIHGMVNLILAVIVDKAGQVHVEESKKVARELHKQHMEAMNKFVDAFAEIDADHNGVITFDDLQRGYDSHEDIKDLMNLNNIHRHDLRMIFDLIDHEGKKSVSLRHFAGELMKVKDENLHILLSVVKQHVKDMHKEIHREILHLQKSGTATTLDSLDASPTYRSDGASNTSSPNPLSRLPAEKKEEKSFFPRPLDVDGDLPWPLDGAQISQLREKLHAQAKQTCDNLENQARLFMESKYCGVNVAALPLKLGNESSELVGREDPHASNFAMSVQKLDVPVRTDHYDDGCDVISPTGGLLENGDKAGLNALDNLRDYSEAYASVPASTKRAPTDSRKRIFDV
jgi:voltage-gated sodium channel